MVTINEVASNECPVSLSRGWAFEMLNLWTSSRRFEGAFLYGPDLSQWPSRMFDSFEIFQSEYDRIESARYKTDNPQSSE
jgi:hypothetical protein